MSGRRAARTAGSAGAGRGGIVAALVAGAFLAGTAPAGAVPAVAPERLVDPVEASGRPVAVQRELAGAEALLGPVVSPAGPAGRRALRAARSAGFIGGSERLFGPAEGRGGLRSWAVRLRTAGDAAGLRDALARAVAAGAPAGARTARTGVRGAATIRLVTVTPRSGAARAVALVAAGPWLHGVEAGPAAGRAAAGEPGADAAEVRTLAGAVADRAAALAAAPGPATPLPVDAALGETLADARVFGRGARAGARVSPREGTVQAAELDGVGHAIALFPGAAEPERFLRRADGTWRWAGDVGGPGCPRLDAALREVWGLAATCPARLSPVAAAAGPGRVADSPLEGVAIWVWEAPKVGGPEGIIRRARALGIDTVYLKSGDGVNHWRQFDAAIGPLRDAGLRVCGWQYIYGRRPVEEARVAARAVRGGAECFIVNAEAEFERMGVGRASAAHRRARAYMRVLRRLVGHRVPVGLSSFAYIDGHPRFPYSAFLHGPDAADAVLPQVYWGAFRVPVATAMARTASWHTLYGVPVAPTAGTYSRERVADLRRFRCLAAGLGWFGVSYWSLQHTRAQQTRALSSERACATPAVAPREYPVLRPGKRGDPSLVLQERLVAWGYPVRRDGHYGPRTRAAVAAFQLDRGARPDGVAGPATWALLLETPAP